MTDSAEGMKLALPSGGSSICPSCGREAEYQGYGPFWECRPKEERVPSCITMGKPLTFCVYPTHGNRLRAEGRYTQADMDFETGKLRDSHSETLQRLFKNHQSDLDAAYARGKQEGEWVSVEDRLPEKKPEKIYYLVQYREDGKFYTDVFPYQFGRWTPNLLLATHWMPLPPAPEVKG